MTSRAPTSPGFFRRLFSRRSSAETAAGGDGAAAAPAQPGSGSGRGAPSVFRCDVCGFTTGARVHVYDHIKAAHRSIADRNAHISEEPETSARSR